jgi:hypothetical protein
LEIYGNDESQKPAQQWLIHTYLLDFYVFFTHYIVSPRVYDMDERATFPWPLASPYLPSPPS